VRQVLVQFVIKLDSVGLREQFIINDNNKGIIFIVITKCRLKRLKL